MIDLHCAHCGGFISRLRHVSYQPAPHTAEAAMPRGDFCDCVTPIVYGPPPGYLSSPGFPAARRQGT